MKFLGVMLLLCLPFLLSCKEGDYPEVEGKPGRTFDPLVCRDTTGTGCDMDWLINTGSEKFPENVELLIAGKVIYDECKRDGNVGIERRIDSILIRVWSYQRLKTEDVDFALQVNDLKDCYAKKSVFYQKEFQKYKIQLVGGQNQVLISF